MVNIEKIVKESIHNFLKEYRKDTFNNAELVSINEINAKTLISRHSKDGYIVISPCRGADDFKDIINPNQSSNEQLAAINNKRINEMIAIIKNSGYSYTPVYGGFIENLGTDKETNVYERSFVIYNHDKNGNVGDFKQLYGLGIQLAKKFNQDSFLCQAPNENPKYITQNGNVDIEFDNNKLAFNDISQEYFTDLHKNTDKFKNANKRTPTRFSYTECFINPSPQCLSESHARRINNEVTLPYRK